MLAGTMWIIVRDGRKIGKFAYAGERAKVILDQEIA